MTTDPRVIECAKASYLRLYPGRIWEALLPSERDLATDFAQRVILKWLELGPSEAMAIAAEKRANDPHHFSAGDAELDYTAMNAQAAKEISE